jgi:putative intracellular protease/amidase
MFGNMTGAIDVKMVAERKAPVRSAQGPSVVIDHSFNDCPHFDLLLVPGGMGTRTEVDNPAMIDWLPRRVAEAELAMTVCTGTALFARAGVLDGRKATTNKLAFHWVAEQGPKVKWVKQARWVEDGKFTACRSAIVPMACATRAGSSRSSSCGRPCVTAQ